MQVGDWSRVVSGEALPEYPEQSVGGMLEARAKRFGDKNAVRFRTRSGRWQELSFQQLHYLTRLAAAGFVEIGVGRGDRALVVAPNGVAMLVAELALVSLGAVSVPVFSEYPPALLAHCARDSGARFALCGGAAQQQRLAQARLPQLERVVVLDEEPLPDPRAVSVPSVLRPLAALPDAELQQRFAKVDALGAQVTRADLAFLLYTSGTTGPPKGVELTHGNVLSQQAAIGAVWDVGERDVFLSYLPWHHCFGSLFERMMALWSGALLVLDDSHGRDLDRLIANIREVKPTVYFSVPRIYQALVGRARADPEVRKALLHEGLRFVFTAAAPLAQPVYRYFEEHDVPVHEGWGLTETSPCATLTRPDRPRVSGIVGVPLPGTEVKLIPAPEWQSADTGEILVRGPQVMRGYHGDPEATAQVLLPDGFLRSGDLGQWTPDGLRVRGRIDGVFKLANGEKVPSSEVETRMLAATPLLDQALVLGSGQPYTSALLWLSPAAARAFAESRGHPELSLAELTLLPEIRRALIEALQSANQLILVPYERVRRVALVPEPLSSETGELTPSFKVVRKVATERHAALIAALQDPAPHPQVLEILRTGARFQNA